MNILMFSEGFGLEKLFINHHGLSSGMYRIATHLREKGHSVRTLAIWRCSTDEFKNIVDPFINQFPDIIGISSTLLYNFPLTEASIDDIFCKINYIKSHSPNSKIIVGGSLTSSMYFNHPAMKKVYKLVDYFVKGQGEGVLDAILDNIENQKKLISNSVSPLIYEDTTYSVDNFETSNIEYLKNDYIESVDALSIEYSRGCIFKCSFCNYPGIGKRPGTFIKSKKTLKDEILKNYEEYGIKFYYFSDDLLNENLEKMRDLADIAASLPFEFRHCSYVRLDLIHKYPEMATLLRDSGAISITAGIETVNDQSGKSVLKGLGINRINETLEMCRELWKNKVGIHGSFIMGLPHDTNDTIYQLLEWFDTPLVKETLTDIIISPLKLFNEMSSKEKYNYKILNENQKTTEWVNKNGYSYKDAVRDSNIANNHFYNKYDLPVRFGAFDIPQMFAFADYHKVTDKISQTYFKREKNNLVSSLEDWNTLRQHWYSDRRNLYINNIKNDIKF
jgi:radical SAM superfamily enzyme YgiQ (UPF0313 family)